MATCLEKLCHDAKRRQTTQNDANRDKYLKNNNSFFDNVENRSLDIKELLNKAAQEGVGLIVGKNEEAAWTAELLAAEISNLDSKAVSLDTRSVQRWFERNGHGIGHENIVRIARVFAAGVMPKSW